MDLHLWMDNSTWNTRSATNTNQRFSVRLWNKKGRMEKMRTSALPGRRPGSPRVVRVCGVAGLSGRRSEREEAGAAAEGGKRGV